ncbi:hypothetical protein [Tolypothrix sp. VBCCA 56010]|uniref:hypothetical protein n=1 Tax=Tolypothrix sp. VBCCA 56010 TaxID=3137731 RepID=UPI003D7DBA1A
MSTQSSFFNRTAKNHVSPSEGYGFILCAIAKHPFLNLTSIVHFNERRNESLLTLTYAKKSLMSTLKVIFLNVS